MRWSTPWIGSSEHVGGAAFSKRPRERSSRRLELEAALEETAHTVSSARHPEWRDRRSAAAWVRADAADGSILSRYLLDTTVLIAHLRGDRAVTDALLQRLSEGHSLGTTCVNIAEIERGLRPAERKKAQVLLDRLTFLDTTREAAIRAGRYQADWVRRGRRFIRRRRSSPVRRGPMAQSW